MAQAEIRRVEVFDALQHAARFDIRRIRDQVLGHSRRTQFFFAETSNAVGAADKVLPITLRVGRVRKTPRKTDDRDRTGIRHGVADQLLPDIACRPP